MPPGARRAVAASASQPSTTEGPSSAGVPAKVELPRVSINGPDGTPKAPSPAPAATANKVCLIDRTCDLSFI